jgi:hypothetical protein
VSAAILALTSLSCNDISGAGTCTLLGCGLGKETGLEIDLVGDLPPNYLVRIQEQDVWIECTEAAPCDRPLFVPGITPTSVFVEVDGQGIEVDAEFIPDYIVTFPNGPSCGECKHGTITVVID